MNAVAVRPTPIDRKTDAMTIRRTRLGARNAKGLLTPAALALLSSFAATGAFAQEAAEGHVADVVVSAPPAEQTSEAVSRQQVDEAQKKPVAATIITQD